MREQQFTGFRANEITNPWVDDYGVKYSPSRKKLISCPKGLISYTILNGTEVICDGAFDNCSYLEKAIPNSVTLIGNGVFDECSSLKKLTIPDSVTHLGNCTFFS